MSLFRKIFFVFLTNTLAQATRKCLSISSEDYIEQLIIEEIGFVQYKTDENKSMNCTFFRSKELARTLWVDMDKYKNLAVTLVDINLETEHPMEVNLSRGFELFGSNINKVELTKEGGIQCNTQDSHWSIAPLMLVADSRPYRIKYIDFGKSLVVQWEIGSYTYENWDKQLQFQVTLHRNGKAEFVYKKIPFGNLQNFEKTVFGISSFFGVDYQYYIGDEKTHYKRTFDLGFLMNIEDFDIQEDTIFSFIPLPMCSNYKTCESCSNASITLNSIAHPCFWCPEIQICYSNNDFLQRALQGRFYCDHPQVSGKFQCKGPEEKKETWSISTSLGLLPFAILSMCCGIVFIKCRYFRRTRARILSVGAQI